MINISVKVMELICPYLKQVKTINFQTYIHMTKKERKKTIEWGLSVRQKFLLLSVMWGDTTVFRMNVSVFLKSIMLLSIVPISKCLD